MQDELERAYESLVVWCRERGYAGYDPFDGLNSRVFQSAPLLKDSRLARLAWTQVFKRSPINLRRLARVPAGRNAKGTALFALAALVGIAWAIYYFLPNIKQNRKQVLAGAVVATVLWIVATLAFRFYVQNFGSYNKTYGAIASVIVLLTWMYLSMLVLLTGGELNSEIHAGTGALKPRRGATLFGDRVATSAGRPSTEQVERLVARGPE